MRITLAELLSNEELRRREFPVVAERLFLAHAGVCPLPRRVAEAIQAGAARSALDDQEASLSPDQIRRTRVLASRFVGVEPTEIAFVGPTSLALSCVAGGLDWRAGDNVVAYLEDYPSNVYPWMALERRGVEARFLEPRSLGRIELADVQAKLDERTRLVALSSAHFLTGFRPDLRGIGRFLREREVRFCVDAIQTLGAFPTPLDAVDYLAADAHKWLLGPCSAGLLCVRSAVQDVLQPVLFGWHNVRCPDFVTQEELVLRRDARRYEPGSQNLLGLTGLRAALELLDEIGIDAIGAELLRKRAWLVPALESDGWEILGAGIPAAHASCILSFRREGIDSGAVQRHLEAAGVITSLRMDRSGRRYVRISPHFYNTDGELGRFLETLRAAARAVG